MGGPTRINGSSFDSNSFVNICVAIRLRRSIRKGSITQESKVMILNVVENESEETKSMKGGGII